VEHDANALEIPVAMCVLHWW